jgi:hypothetical protein
MDLFECPGLAGNVKLTAYGCANNWHRARKEHADKGHALYACRGCPIGAANAGEPEQHDSVALEGVCVRCHRPSTRLLKEKSICVSCWNREREVRIGKDRRGHVPKSLPRARQHVVTATGPDGPVDLAWSSASAVETVLYAMKKTQGSGVVSKAVIRVGRQFTFFGAV